MNALANSQLEEPHTFISNERGAKPVTFARYTGQEDAETRRRISENPPDILLTNFMMLEQQSTAITYTHNGRPYVTIASGRGGTLASRYTGDKVPTGGSFWTFALMPD